MSKKFGQYKKLNYLCIATGALFFFVRLFSTAIAFISRIAIAKEAVLAVAFLAYPEAKED